MRKYAGPALFAILLCTLVMAAFPAWAEDRVSDGDPIRNEDFTCPEGSSPVPDEATDSGFTCVEDPADPESEPVEEVTTTTSAPPVDDSDPTEPPGPTATTADDVVVPGSSINPCPRGGVPASPNWQDSDVVECVGPTTTTSDEVIVPPPTTSGVGTVSLEQTGTAPTTTVQSGEGELPFTGTGPAVLVAGLAFLAVGAMVFLVARVVPKR